jgi:hypothetical protein
MYMATFMASYSFSTQGMLKIKDILLNPQMRYIYTFLIKRYLYDEILPWSENISHK